MRNDNYLPCDRYFGYDIQPNGFSSFQDPENNHYYFAFFDEDDLIFRSEGYGTISGRDNGIISVQKNMKVEEHFKVKMLPDGKWVLSLRAGNHQEIGRSCGHSSEKDALALMPSARAERKAAAAAAVIAASATTASKTGTATAKAVRQDDDYLACKMYHGHKRSTSNADFSTFTHDGEFYFAMLNNNDEVVLRSEGYKTEKSRDNGITSVTKNRTDKNQYSVETKMNYHFVVLKAKNYQEIGRSCPYKTLEEANNFINPVATPIAAVAAPIAAVKAPVVEKTTIVDREDDYLACKQYEGHRINDKHNNVALFKHENGLFYFSLYDEHGRVRLRSEGFVDAKTRDEELSGVLKYKDDKSMYSKIEKGSYYMDVLKDKTGREVGRSCLKKVAAPAVVAAGPPDREDDYLPCKAYQGHEVNDKVNNIAFFRNDGLLYFVLYDKNGGVRLRSEGFPNAKQRDEELSGVLRYKDDKSLYSRIERSGYYMDVLKDKTGREVGRSCLTKVAAPAVVAAGPPDREDDYLPCKAYQGHEVNDKVNNVAFFKNDGLFYFALYDKNGGVRLRSEGFPNAQQRDEELSGVLRYKDDKSLYSRIERSGYYMDVLKDKTGREVGRSCLTKKELAAPVKIATPPPVAVKKEVKVTPEPTPVKAEPIIAAASAAVVAGGAAAVGATAKTPTTVKKAPVAKAPIKKAPVAAAPVAPVAAKGFNWAWLLLPVLLIGSFLLYRYFNNTPTKAAVVPPKVETPVAETATPPPATPKVAAAPVATPISCDLQWILFNFDRYNIRPDAAKELDELAALLKKNKGTVASLVAHTDARGSVEYNNTLSRNRANEAKKYLQGKGIAASRIKTSAQSESNPYAKNTDDDSGRQFNRRVELFLLDADGQEVCNSKAPRISNALMVK